MGFCISVLSILTPLAYCYVLPLRLKYFIYAFTYIASLEHGSVSHMPRDYTHLLLLMPQQTLEIELESSDL
jgi:hypothetical protein